jgi:GPH family glycoside/pentoside/hexuronide:cation symporter
MQYVSNTITNYMFSAVYDDLALVTYGSIVSAPFMMVTLFGGPFFAKKYGLERFIRFGLLVGAIMYMGLFGLHMVTDVNPYVHMVISNCAMGLASVSIYMQWGLVSETVNYNAYLTGKRTEGTIFGVFNMLRRVGQAIGSALSVATLGWVGYDVALANSGLQQSAGTLMGMKVLCFLLPAVFILGSWAAFRFLWNITPEVREKMASEKGNF